MFKDGTYRRITGGHVGEVYFLKMRRVSGMYPIDVYLDSEMKRELGSLSINYANKNYKFIKPRKRSGRATFKEWCKK